MAFTNKRLIKGSPLSTTTSTYYTVPTSTTTIIHKITFSNFDTSPRDITLYLVASGATAGTSNAICNACKLFPGETWSPPDVVGHVLEAGGTIQAKISSGTSVNIIASGVEIAV